MINAINQQTIYEVTEKTMKVVSFRAAGPILLTSRGSPQIIRMSVPQVPSCLPRGGLVQGWGSVCWGVEGILLILNWKLVPCFLVSWFSTFQNCQVSTIPFHVCCKIFIPYYQHSVSCFLDDIDLIFKISRNFKTDLHDLSAPVFSENTTNSFPENDVSRNIIS